MSRTPALRTITLLSLSLAGCSGPSTPTMPSSAAAPAQLAARADTHGLELTALLGTGRGIVNVTPTAAVDGSFSAQISVNVHGVPPNTSLIVQRAPEIGRANGSDEICQRAAGAPPWGPPTPNFVTFPMPAAALETSAGGSGATHLDFGATTIPDGTRFDVMFRLVDNVTAPTIELRTGCFTVTVK